MLQSFLKDLIIGPGKYIQSWSARRRAMLTGMLSILISIVSIFYLTFDVINGVYRSLPVYFILSTGSIVSFFLNRKEKYNLAKYAILFTANLTVYLFASRETEGIGSYMFFIPNSLGAFTLFSYEDRHKGFYFTLLSVFLFLMVTVFDYSPLPKVPFPSEYVKLNFVINFLVCTLTSVMILMFLIVINNKSEGELKNNQYNLLNLTDELRKSRSRFELAIQGSSAGIWEWSIGDNVLYSSPALKTILGFGNDDLDNAPFDGFINSIHPDDLNRVEASIKAHLEDRVPFKEEFRLLSKNGDYKWVLDTGQAEWDEMGRATRVVGTIININERKEAEYRVKKQNEMLAKTNQELDRFVYSTSHDLRAPLMSVLGLINIAEKSPRQDDVSRCLEMMKDRIKTLDDFIQEIIDYSRNSRTEVDLTHFELAPLVEKIIDNLKYMNEFNKIKAILEIQPGLTVKSDPGRLKVILNNLISNGIKYSDQEKTNPYIKIQTKVKGDDLQIVVEDNGEGIPKEGRQKVFDMFYRASERSKGSGLGLYIVKEMVDKLNGEVKIESEEGKGAAFKIYLPGSVASV